MRPLPIACAMLLVLVTIGCRNETKPGPMITAPGTFKLFGGRMTVTISANTNGAVTYRIKQGESVTGPSRPELRAGQPWFIFPQSSTNVWVFDGRTNVSVFEFNAAGTRRRTSQRDPDLWKNIPPEVRQKIPASVGG